MTELALDHIEGNALASHLDRMGVAKLMRSKASPNPRLDAELAKPSPGR